MSNRSKQFVTDAIKNLPANLIKDIQNEFDIKYKKLVEWSLQLNKDEKNRALIQIVNTYNDVVNKCAIAISKLINIYRRRELGNIGILGVESNYTYFNPDPEDLIGKVERDGPDKPYMKIGKLIKYIFDGNDDLEEFVPKNLDESIDKWSNNNSFIYWQIYAILVENILRRKVDLSVLRSIDALGKYKTRPFFRKIEEPQFEKKKNQGKKGGQFKPRSNFKSNFRPKSDVKNRINEAKKNIEANRQYDNETYKRILEKIKIIHGENIEFKTLWEDSKEKLSKALKETAPDPIAPFTEKKCMDNDFNIKFEPLSAVDPLTRLKYKERDLKNLYSDQLIKKLKEDIANVLKRIKNELKNDGYDITYQEIVDRYVETKPSLVKELLNYKICFKRFNEDSIKEIAESMEKGKNKKKLDIENRIFLKQLSMEGMRKYLIKKYICKDYSIFVINFVERLATPGERNKFYTLREKIVKLLVGYYGTSIKEINIFVKKIKSKFGIENKNIKKTIVKNRVKEVEEEEEIKLLEDDKKILDKVDRMIVKYPPNSPIRKKMVEKREELYQKLLERAKERLKKQMEKKEFKKNFRKNYKRNNYKKNIINEKANNKNINENNKNENNKNINNKNTNNNKNEDNDIII